MMNEAYIMGFYWGYKQGYSDGLKISAVNIMFTDFLMNDKEVLDKIKEYKKGGIKDE